jgi:hypothetical protein
MDRGTTLLRAMAFDIYAAAFPRDWTRLIPCFEMPDKHIDTLGQLGEYS